MCQFAAQTHATQLQTALTNRAAIDQAIGILRSRSGGTADEAFARLRQISQSENTKLAVVAETVVGEAPHLARGQVVHERVPTQVHQRLSRRHA
ncbi:MAG: hypothetical protein DLM58_12775 [Pseudonocardiales bacterium]|nr:MAG: hypothetical protein DLM58_12775 [Pseudonocardiales bacterium]